MTKPNITVKEHYFDRNNQPVQPEVEDLYGFKLVRYTFGPDGTLLGREVFFRRGPIPPAAPPVDEAEAGIPVKMDEDIEPFEAAMGPKAELKAKVEALEQVYKAAKTPKEQNEAITKVVDFLAGRKG
jgi:hypothetical protein